MQAASILLPTYGEAGRLQQQIGTNKVILGMALDIWVKVHKRTENGVTNLPLRRLEGSRKYLSKKLPRPALCPWPYWFSLGILSDTYMSTFYGIWKIRAHDLFFRHPLWGALWEEHQAPPISWRVYSSPVQMSRPIWFPMPFCVSAYLSLKLTILDVYKKNYDHVMWSYKPYNYCWESLRWNADGLTTQGIYLRSCKINSLRELEQYYNC